MRLSRLTAQAVGALVGCALFALPSYAIDLTGLWATQDAPCDKMFVKEGNEFSLRRDADLYGGGFIIEGSRIKAPTATCTIKSRSEEADIVHLFAACSTEIMFSNVQLSLRVIDANKISRIFPGMPDMKLTYVRCSL